MLNSSPQFGRSPLGVPVRQRRVPAHHLRLIPPYKPLHPLLSRRDPDLIRSVFPRMAAVVDRYFRAEMEGVENLLDGRALTISTHNGGLAMPDMFCLMVAYWRRFGLETPGYGMIHNIALKIPILGKYFSRLGALPACRENAEIVLDEGHMLMVCPGGDIDSLKPFSERHRVTFGARRGFIKLAIRKQVPIVPVVSVGAHETLYVVNDGQRLARQLMFDRLFRVKTIPVTIGFPIGVTLGGLGTLPLPAKIVQRVLPRIELDEPPAAADDPRRVERCFEHVRQQMQRGLDQLAARRKNIFLG